jgi:hypothetical protein
MLFNNIEICTHVFIAVIGQLDIIELHKWFMEY